MKTPIDVLCSHSFEDRVNCNAQPGRPCQRMNYYRSGDRLVLPFHQERIDAANFVNSLDHSAPPGETMPVTAKEIEETGLF